MKENFVSILRIIKTRIDDKLKEDEDNDLLKRLVKLKITQIKAHNEFYLNTYEWS